MTRNSLRVTASSGAFAIALLGAFSAHAQTMPADSAGVSDIIVTAQRRSESMRTVPMSITAASAATLAERGVANPDDLGKVAPGFVATKSAYGVPVYTLRGVGFYDYSLGAIPAVTVYADQVPIPYSIMSTFAAADVERVEVLKGPQGALYGLNSTAGAINFVAAKPTDSLSAGGSLTYGSYDQLDARAFVSGPLTDTLGVRISGNAETGGGYQRSLTRPDDHRGDRRRYYGRFLADWHPSERTTIEINVSGGIDRSDTAAVQFQQVSPLFLSNPATAAALALYLPNLAAQQKAPDNARAADWDSGVRLRNDNTSLQASATATFELSDSLSLRSTSSYQSFVTKNVFDGDGTPLQDFLGTINGNIKVYYQELILQGSIGDRLNFIAGGNYMHDKVDQNQLGQYRYSLVGLRAPDALSIGNQSTNSYSVFGNVDFKITPELTAQGGVRYSRSIRDFTGCTQPRGVPTCLTILPDGTTGRFFTNRLDEDNVSWRAGLKYQPIKDLMLYANVSRGYKAGSYPIVGATNYKQLLPVTQESVMAYEVGTKFNIGRAIDVDAAAFYYDYSNKQVRGRYIDPLLGALSKLVNVPKSSIAGVEISARLRPFRGLTIQASGTYIDSRIDKDFVNFDFAGFSQNFHGQRLPFSPSLTTNLDVGYEFGVGSGTAFAGATVVNQSASNAGLGDLEVARIPAFTTLDLRAGYRGKDDAWSVTVFGRNVTNKYYWTGTQLILDVITRTAAPPATYGVTLGVRF